jgi:cleavage and polyadenylation specificity factor subunit 2
VLSLASDCKELLGIKTVGGEEEPATEILTPSEGQTIDASVDTNAWVVKLSRSLTKTLHWQNVKNMGVVTLQALLRGEQSHGTNLEDDPQTKKQKLDTQTSLQTAAQSRNQSEPMLDVLPPSLAASTRTVSQAIHVGDLRLADLRRVIAMDGHVAEFRGEGTLLVDGMVAVKKLSSGKIIVEGVPISVMTPRATDNFTRVKQKIYDGLAVVAAG